MNGVSLFTDGMLSENPGIGLLTYGDLDAEADELPTEQVGLRARMPGQFAVRAQLLPQEVSGLDGLKGRRGRVGAWRGKVGPP